jgi:hypothetical protein
VFCDFEAFALAGEGIAAAFAIIWLTQLLSLAILTRRTRPMSDEELRHLEEFINPNNKES